MIRDNKKVTIIPRKNMSQFQQVNSKVILGETEKIGSSISAVNKMLANGDELKSLMPTILGANPNSMLSNWDKLVANYWHSLSVPVPREGLVLEIGLIYDVDDPNKKDAIKGLVENKKVKIESDTDLQNYLESVDKSGNPIVLEERKYQFATPINTNDYLLWRYCLVYGDVANHIDLVDKASRIRFYIQSDSEIKKAKKNLLVVKEDALAKYLEAIKNETIVNNILIVSKIDITNLDISAKKQLLMEMVETRPSEFVAIFNDKNLQLKSEIESMIFKGLLKRLPNTSAITDSDNPSIILGNNLDEAVSYFTNVSNKVMITEYRNKLKAILSEHV